MGKTLPRDPFMATLTERERNSALRTSTDPVPGSSGPVLIIGAAHSGTSWLGKIFDSHPNVIYRHEAHDAIGQKELPLVWRIFRGVSKRRGAVLLQKTGWESVLW